MLFHVIWTTSRVWSPADARGDWNDLALTYAELTQRHGYIRMSHPLDRRWQAVRQEGALELSPFTRTHVDHSIRELAQNDRVAGDTPIRALAVQPYAVQVVLACPVEVLQQRVGRLKSATSTETGRWSRGFWWARLEEAAVAEAITAFVNGARD